MWDLVLLFKIAVSALIFYTVDYSKRKEYYYYSNLGFSKLKLWIPVALVDMLVFSALITAANLS